MSFVWRPCYGLRRLKTIVGKQLLKKKQESAKQKDRNSFGIPHPPNLTTANPCKFKSTANLSVDHRQVPFAAFGATTTDQRFVHYFFLKIHAEKKDIFNTVASSKEITLPKCELDRDWEYL